MDLKAMYQEEVEELAERGFLLVETGLITWEDKEFYDLPKVIQEALYTKAVELVHDKLADSADILRKGELEK